MQAQTTPTVSLPHHLRSKKMMQLEADARRELAEALHEPVSDTLWEALHNTVWDHVKYERDGVQFLVEHVEAIRAELSSPRRAPRTARGRKPSDVPTANWARSRLVAALAADDDQVQAFRREVLDDRLIEWAQLDAWIAAQVHAQGEATWSVTIPVPSGTRITHDPSGGWRFKPLVRHVDRLAFSSRILSYFGPADDWLQHVHTATDGPLERLRRLAQQLAPAYGWTEPQAAVFVLTGTPQLVEPVQVTARSEHIRNGRHHPWAQRITLQIDPTTPPDTVERVYRQVRQQLGIANTRTLSDKHANLALILLDQPHQTWATRLKRWNHEHPEWCYYQESNLRRDALLARHRLLNPTTDQPRSDPPSGPATTKSSSKTRFPPHSASSSNDKYVTSSLQSARHRTKRIERQL
jgi:hypothetical protein